VRARHATPIKEKAKSPPPLEFGQVRRRFGTKPVLFDTFSKSGSTLLRFLPLPERAQIGWRQEEQHPRRRGG
jgi:hypothetical protein